MASSPAHRQTTADECRRPSVRHYLIVKTSNRTPIHHRRDETGELPTRTLREGAFELQPPGRDARRRGTLPLRLNEAGPHNGAA
jgi:hypothetical protein